MSPPLEIHQKTGSIGVDNEISLLSSPKPHDDQAMDLFLNQVAEYNAQQLSFEQQQQNQPSSSTNNIGNLTRFFMLFYLFIHHHLFFSFLFFRRGPSTCLGSAKSG